MNLVLPKNSYSRTQPGQQTVVSTEVNHMGQPPKVPKCPVRTVGNNFCVIARLAESRSRDWVCWVACGSSCDRKRFGTVVFGEPHRAESGEQTGKLTININNFISDQIEREYVRIRTNALAGPRQKKLRMKKVSSRFSNFNNVNSR